MSYQDMNQELVKDCSILELDPACIEKYQIRDIIKQYRKKAREVHPDKFANATEEEKKIKTKEFQALNNAYERVLKQVLENNKDKPEHEADDAKNS